MTRLRESPDVREEYWYQVFNFSVEWTGLRRLCVSTLSLVFWCIFEVELSFFSFLPFTCNLVSGLFRMTSVFFSSKTGPSFHFKDRLVRPSVRDPDERPSFKEREIRNNDIGVFLRGTVFTNYKNMDKISNLLTPGLSLKWVSVCLRFESSKLTTRRRQ